MVCLNSARLLANVEAIFLAFFRRTMPFPTLTDFALSARSLSNLRNSSIPEFLSVSSYKDNYTKMLQLS